MKALLSLSAVLAMSRVTATLAFDPPYRRGGLSFTERELSFAPEDLAPEQIERLLLDPAITLTGNGPSEAEAAARAEAAAAKAEAKAAASKAKAEAKAKADADAQAQAEAEAEAKAQAEADAAANAKAAGETPIDDASPKEKADDGQG